MRKYLVFLLMSLMKTMAWGVKVISLLPEELGDMEAVQGNQCVTKDCVTMCCTSGIFNQTQFRFYKNSVTTFTSTCGDIIKIEFTCTTEGENQYGPGCFTADSGDYSYQGKTGLWEGAAAQVSFTAVTNQVRATRIDVYVNDDCALYPPKIEPAAGTYYEPIEVKISCMSSESAIYYTLDGSDPTIASTLYTEPFTLSNDATVKAVAELDGEMSDVVSAAYKFSAALPVSFGMLEDVDDDTEVAMTNDATVIAQVGSYLFVFDWTGYGLVYGNTGQTYKMGDVIPAGFGGVKVTYNCEPELKNPRGLQAPIGHVEVEPEEITPQQVNHSTWGHYVVIRNVRIDPKNKLFLDEEGKECPFYNRFSIVIPEDTEGLYDVYGVVGSYGHNGDCIYQVMPLRIERRSDPIKVCCIEDVLAQPEGVPVQFECPLIMVYQKSNYLFVKDKCDDYTLMYGRMNGTFVNGDSIIGAVTWNTYQGLPQLAPYGDWRLVSHGPKVPPVGPMMIGEISRDMVHWYVYFEDVTVVKDKERDRYYTMIDKDGDEMLMFNRLNIEIPTDYIISVVGPELNISFLNKIIEYILTGKLLPPPDPVIDGEDITWKPCRVEGLVSIYQNQLELVPTRVTYYGANCEWDDHIYDLNNDGAINVSDLNVGIELILKR